MDRRNKIKLIVGIIPSIAIVMAIGVLSLHLSPCNFVSGAIVCDSETLTKFENSLRVDGEIIISGTPTTVDILSSNGDNNSPLWLNAQWRKTVKSSDTSISNDSVADTDPHIGTINVDMGEVVSFEYYLSFTTTDTTGTVDARVTFNGNEEKHYCFHDGLDAENFACDSTTNIFRCNLIDTAGEVICKLTGTMYNVGVTDSAIDIRWSQFNSDASTLTLQGSKSYVLYRTIANLDF